jgi:hypothetical protein
MPIFGSIIWTKDSYTLSVRRLLSESLIVFQGLVKILKTIKKRKIYAGDMRWITS